MRTAKRAILPLVALLLLLPAPLLAQEQPIEVLGTSVSFSFGQQATFSIEVTAPAEVGEIYLYLHNEGEDRVTVVPLQFTADTAVQANLQRDLRQQPLPPFGLVTWWWEVRDDAGNSLTTPHQVFRYVDNRFDWQTASTGPVHVHTVYNDPAYVQAALDISRASLGNIAQSLAVPLPEEVNVYLYPSQGDLRAALEMAGREWAGGQARPELGVVLVAIPYDDEYTARMEQYIPHELTHLLVYLCTGAAGYSHVPAWLDEGLATANETRPDPGMDAILEQARATGHLIPLPELCAPFPPDPQVALLSYAQSGSLVRYIRARYGSAGIRSLLAAYADGAGCEGGTVGGLGITLERLDLAWRVRDGGAGHDAGR